MSLHSDFNPASVTSAALLDGLRRGASGNPLSAHSAGGRDNHALRRKPSAAPAVPESTPVVFVVDDDVSVRESLEALFRFEGWQVVTFGTAQAFLSCHRPRAASCLVLDVELPDLSGLALQERLGAAQSCIPIVFVTGHGDVPMSVRAMKAGAFEFLTKPVDHDALLIAVGDAIAQSRANLAAEAELKGLRDAYAGLSERERDVMALIVSGLLNKQVGGELGISEITVKVHRGRVMRKMSAGSFADLVRMAGVLGIAPRQCEK